MVSEFTGRVGLFLGVACANLMSVCLILGIVEDAIYFLIPGFMSTIGMILGFRIYCHSSNTDECQSIGGDIIDK